MSFEDVMGAVMRWAAATDALAALGAELALQDPETNGHPEIVDALRAVSTAAGLDGLEEIPPPQRAMAIGLIRMFLHQATDLVDNPDRAPGWAFTDPTILDGYGRGSMMVPPLIAGAHPDLAEVTSFLDVGTGVGLLAVSAAGVWPKATVVGIDPWETSLERARANVAAAGLDDRITLRRQELAELDDVDAFDCVWIPTFFLPEAGLEKALPTVVRALRPGGWIALGRFHDVADPLARATDDLQTIRGGGFSLRADRGIELLEQAGCDSAHVASSPGPAPLELVLGRRPA